MHDGLWGATHDSKEVRGFELIWLLGGFLSIINGEFIFVIETF